MSLARSSACRAQGAAPGAGASSSGVWMRPPLRHLPPRCPLRRTAAKRDDDAPAMGGLDPTLEVAVPKEQRPVNELKQLKEGQLYSWVSS
jgi:hypothetical protein